MPANPPWLTALCALVIAATVSFTAWRVYPLLRDVPLWDEFITVLGFVNDYQRAEDLGQFLPRLLETSNEHRTLTSRVIMIALYELTGHVNFIHLALIGNLFVVLALAVIGLAPGRDGRGLMLAALAALLTLHLQHYENLLSSCASIDHFQIVFLAVLTLACLARRGPAWLAAAGVAGTLTVFTLTHGFAVFAAGTLLLFAQSRRRALGLWLLLGAANVVVFLSSPGALRPDHMPAADSAAWGSFLAYWFTQTGSAVTFGHTWAAPIAGFTAIVAFLVFAARGWFAREPFAMAVAASALVSGALISLGRSGNFLAAPPDTSRYVVQSALVWAVLLWLGWRATEAKWNPRLAAVAMLALVGAINLSGNALFAPDASAFVRKRITAARTYDQRGSLAEAAPLVFPNRVIADRILMDAEKNRVFELRPRRSPPARLPREQEERAMDYYLDAQVLARHHVHLRGWVLPPADGGPLPVPILRLRSGFTERLYRGAIEERPDVAGHFSRPDATACGFYFVVPRRELGDDDWSVDFIRKDKDRAVFTRTGHVVSARPATPTAAR